jgi:alkanesulfonate monooxygenase SsuD/methylene tetrahydromethanopterin reductase-like flavin-dependent oxidoreductase (luciferase family)
VKICFLGPGAYAGRVERAGWPVPPELCDRQTAAKSYSILLDQFQLADELGFDWISMSEHHFAPGLMTPNPIVVAGAASQRTRNVRIALLGPLLPLTNPVRVAEEIAMLDSINGGRTVVLFLRGTPNEHLTYSQDGRASPYTREITQEGAQLILKAWTEPEPFSWRGQFFNFEHVSVWPRTLQEPHPPVFYSGNSFESIDFAAAHHLNLAIGFAPVANVAEHVAYYKKKAAEAGWQPTNENVLYRARALVAQDDEQAAELVARTRPAPRPAVEGGAGSQTGTRYGPSATAEAPQRPAGEGGGAPGVAGFQFFGTPKTIVEQAKKYRDAGVGILDVAFAGDAMGGTRRAMEVFADVIPDLHAL